MSLRHSHIVSGEVPNHGTIEQVIQTLFVKYDVVMSNSNQVRGLVFKRLGYQRDMKAHVAGVSKSKSMLSSLILYILIHRFTLTD